MAAVDSPSRHRAHALLTFPCKDCESVSGHWRENARVSLLHLQGTLTGLFENLSMSKVKCAWKRDKKLYQNIKHDCFEWWKYGLLFCLCLLVVNCAARVFVCFSHSMWHRRHSLIPGTSYAWSHPLQLDFLLTWASETDWADFFFYYQTNKD